MATISDLEEIVRQFTRDKLVSPGDLLVNQAEHEPVHRTKVVQVAGVVEFFVEFDEERDLWEVFIAPS